MKTVLSIDSGTGLAPSSVLRDLSIHLGLQHTLHYAFDAVSGSGSGAVIALALAWGWGPPEAHYLVGGGLYRKGLFGKRSVRKSVLKTYFGDVVLGESVIPVTVPVYSVDTRKTEWISSWSHPNVSFVDLVATVASVPTLSKPTRSLGFRAVSGEIFVPDPSVHLFGECLRRFGEGVNMLSLAGDRLEYGPEILVRQGDWGKAIPGLPHTRAPLTMEALHHHGLATYHRVEGDRFDSAPMSQFLELVH